MCTYCQAQDHRYAACPQWTVDQKTAAREKRTQRLEGKRGYQHPLHGGYVPQPVIAPREVMCSFCGANTHDYRDCPVMHQYIREQADALAQRRLEEYQQPREWEGYEIPKQAPPY